jgi:hypothetical protein
MSATDKGSSPRTPELPAEQAGGVKAAVKSTLPSATAAAETKTVIGEAAKKPEKAEKVEKVEKGPTVELPPVAIPVTRDELAAILEANNEGIMKANLQSAMEISERVSKSVAEQTVQDALPEIRKGIEGAVERKMKLAAARNHGMTIFTASMVFAVGSLAKIGYEYFNKGSSAE